MRSTTRSEASDSGMSSASTRSEAGVAGSATKGAGPRGAASMDTSKPKSGAAQGGVSAHQRAALPRDPSGPVPHDPRIPFNLYRGPGNCQSDCGLELALEIPDIDGRGAAIGPVRRVAATGEHRGEPALLRRTLARGGGGEHGADLEEPDIGDVVRPVPLDQPDQTGEHAVAKVGIFRR